MENKSKGFSLIELIVLLTTISCILAAFIPIVTKKSHEHYTSYADQKLKNLKTDCIKEFNSHCLLCEGTKRCIICELSCVSGKTVDTDKCICK